MRRLWVTALAAMVLLSFAALASAQTPMETLQNQVKQLQGQLQQALDRIQKLEAEKAPAVAAPAAGPAPVQKECWYDKICINGYWHARFESRRNKLVAPAGFANYSPSVPWGLMSVADNNSDFILRRVYLNVIGNFGRTQAVAVLRRLGPGNNIDLEAAFAKYGIDDQWSVEFGRVYNKFGWDAAESSSKRLVLDRFAAIEGYAPAGVRGLYFAGPTDHGFYINRASSGREWEPSVSLGLLNGNFTDPDNNRNKTVELDLKWNHKGTQFGASYLTGWYLDSASFNPLPPPATVAVNQPRRMVGLFIHTDPKPWGFQAEWVEGQLFGHDVDGGYGQVAHNSGKGTTYARWESFDPNNDQSGDTYRGWRVGYAHQLDKNNELTLEWMKTKRGPVDVGQVGFQWQLAL